MKDKILVTGAGGYVGTKLIMKLLESNYKVKALDAYWFSSENLIFHPNLEVIKADLRDANFEAILKDVDKVVHLACISNDPSYELNPTVSKEINYYATLQFINECKRAQISRFVFASSSSVYGIKEEENVTEDLPTNPLTDYSILKLKVEFELLDKYKDFFDIVILRPATICGPSPRMRLDVVGNIFSAQGYFDQKITIDGGDQYRSQLHIDDMVRAYELTISDKKNFSGAIYNVSDNNYTVSELAHTVQKILNGRTSVTVKPVFDYRSYRINSDKFKIERGFVPLFTFENAVEDNMVFFNKNNGMNWQDDKFHNIKTLKSLRL